jgi:hypothetical protein
MVEELKIVIVLKKNRASVGIQAPECDPIISLVNGDLDEILEGIPKLLERAQARWAEAKTYPKCEAKLELPAKPPQRPEPVKREAKTQPAKDEAHPMLF